MNVEIERDGTKVTIDAPSVKEVDDIKALVQIAREAFDQVAARKQPPPLPFGFSVWADTERRPSVDFDASDDCHA